MSMMPPGPEDNLAVHPAADLFPLLPDDELADLAADIKANGLHEPVWLYDDPQLGRVLLDGRNRRRACQIAGVPLKTRTYAGDSPTTFVISENVRRRHLSTGQLAAVAHDSLPLFESEAKRRKAEAAAAEQRRRAAGRSVQDEAELPHPERPRMALPKPKRAPQARDRAASTVGISGRAVAQYKRIDAEAPDLAEKVKSGELALDRAERIVRDRQAEQKRIEQARADAERAEEKTRVDIRHGDFRDALADLSDVDAIITDPPYPAEFLPLLDELGAWADKVLGPDGVLAVLIGQTHLPEVYRRLDGHRPYRWTGCYLTPGAGYVSHPRRVSSNWKPLLVYGGGRRFADVIRSEGTDAGAKNLHHWGQDYGAFHTIVERLTSRGQTVVDPFMGSGTTLLAARALGRHAIGCDLDPAHVETSRRRLL